MDKTAIKHMMYGGIKELMADRRYYYTSGIGRQYDHFTDDGKLALYQFASDMAFYIAEAENKELDSRARDMVLKELKGN
jgi:hypothetical protein